MKPYAPDAIPIFFNGYGYQGSRLTAQQRLLPVLPNRPHQLRRRPANAHDRDEPWLDATCATTSTPSYSFRFQVPAATLTIPLISNEPVNIGEKRLLAQELAEFFHERPQSRLLHGWNELVMHEIG